MIYLTGDTHGCFEKLASTVFPEGKTLTKNDYVIILGDFGAIWNVSMINAEKYWLNWLNNKPWTTLFVDGNHENFDRLYSTEFKELDMFNDKVKQVSESVFWLQRGRIYIIDDLKLFAMGGGVSIDKCHRQEYVSWWRQETPTFQEFDKGLDNLSKYNNTVDYILTHTAPRRIIDEIGFLEKLNDPVANYLDQLFDLVSFKKHYFGHLHLDLEIEFDGKLLRGMYNDIIQLT